MSNPNYRRATWTCMGLAFANQMAGINIINLLSTPIFQKLSNDITLTNTIKFDNYFLGGCGFVGSVLANVTVTFLSKRAVFIGGHAFIMIGLLLIYVFVELKMADYYVLMAMCLCILSFQMSNGATFWIYASEVIVDSAFAICLVILWGVLLIQSLTSLSLVNIDGYGVKGLFLTLAVFQALIILYMLFFLKETKGLNSGQKKNLYKPKN